MGLLDLVNGFLKGKDKSEMIEAAKEKLQDGSLDSVLEKIGVDGDKLGETLGKVASVVDGIENAVGKSHEEESE